MLRDRKRSEDQVNADAKLTTIAGDIDTYIALATEETNAAQRNDLIKDLDRELTNAETFVSEQETRKFILPSECFTPKPVLKGLHGGGHGTHPRNEVKGLSAAVGKFLSDETVRARCAEPISKP